ncbi:MAG TPA: hypothetical protein VN690_11370 [Terriglobales bacterium]|nr:hypothetical protein [Terriglobales bacterium]
MLDLAGQARAAQSSNAKFLFVKLAVPFAIVAAGAMIVSGPGSPEQVVVRWVAAVALAAASMPFVVRLHRATVSRAGLEVKYLRKNRVIQFGHIESCRAPFGNGTYATVKLRGGGERLLITLGGGLLTRASADPLLNRLRTVLDAKPFSKQPPNEDTRGRAQPLLCQASFLLGLSLGVLESIGRNAAAVSAKPIADLTWPPWAIILLVAALLAWCVRVRFGIKAILPSFAAGAGIAALILKIAIR